MMSVYIGFGEESALTIAGVPCCEKHELCSRILYSVLPKMTYNMHTHRSLARPKSLGMRGKLLPQHRATRFLFCFAFRFSPSSLSLFFKEQRLISHNSEAWKVQDQGSCWFRSWWELSPVLYKAIFSLRPHVSFHGCMNLGREREGERASQVFMKVSLIGICHMYRYQLNKLWLVSRHKTDHTTTFDV